MREPRPSRFANRKPKPPENKAAEPVEDVKIVHKGNGWYEVAGVRVRGREAAEALAQESES